jgi:hypothetical protein
MLLHLRWTLAGTFSTRTLFIYLLFASIVNLTVNDLKLVTPTEQAVIAEITDIRISVQHIWVNL